MDNQAKQENVSEQTDESQEYGNYRRLGQPPDTISGATKDLLEVRPSGNPAQNDTSATTFKIIAVIAIIALVAGIVASQLGVMP